MGQKNINIAVKSFKRLFSESKINALGKCTRFCKRNRLITPFKLALSLIAGLGNAKVSTLAELQRNFNAITGANIEYKPFHNQLRKKQFPEFMRRLCERIMDEFQLNVLSFSEDSPFKQFEKILIHDGSSFALKSTLQQHFPGRFNTIKPAAVELHVTMNLLSESIESITLAPDTESEHAHKPCAQSIKGNLLLADRQYMSKQYFHAINAAQGHYIIRTKTGIVPEVKHVFSDKGKPIHCRTLGKLKAISHKLKRFGHVDLDIQWGELTCRLLILWDKGKKAPVYLATNLPREQFSFEDVFQGYQMRWQIELLFKEWKSHANLHRFDTSNVQIAEGLIWASLCAAMVKRLIALHTQKVKQLPISIRKVAMSMIHVMPQIVHAVLNQVRHIKKALMRAFDYFQGNARRSHLHREKLKGRLAVGLEYELRYS